LRPVNYASGNIAIGIAVAYSTGIGDLFGRLNKISTPRVDVLALLFAYINNLYMKIDSLYTYKVAKEDRRPPFMRYTRTSSCRHTARNIGNIGEMADVGDCLINTG
jgi:hypothetical protein